MDRANAMRAIQHAAIAAVHRRGTMINSAARWINSAIARTSASAHWLTDTVGGPLIGSGVALLTAVDFARGPGVERRAAGHVPRSRVARLSAMSADRDPAADATAAELARLAARLPSPTRTEGTAR